MWRGDFGLLAVVIAAVEAFLDARPVLQRRSEEVASIGYFEPNSQLAPLELTTLSRTNTLSRSSIGLSNEWDVIGDAICSISLSSVLGSSILSSGVQLGLLHLLQCSESLHLLRGLRNSILDACRLLQRC